MNRQTLPVGAKPKGGSAPKCEWLANKKSCDPQKECFWGGFKKVSKI
ncbi:hypothetical protein VCHA35O141_60166 [Vibrio chagasii]|nr:hypothetical protein VCHA38P215_110020 [Vibrio chagasii]CAH6932346.1 hypothetical protein VCHA48P434_110168 [Vibrio chagasii]CAH7038768.1 hypothetical protein VCHA31O73_60038 [Vibrio chagasii]CAH7061423.1 hypothetical protein VCHA35O141_60166 [Vibrio chagasii]CAH7088816.1 hypothetical protein VCHA35O143_70167 [Vibrio chagasii]